MDPHLSRRLARRGSMLRRHAATLPGVALRALCILAAFGPASLVWTVPAVRTIPWLGPLLVVVAALPVLIARRRAPTLLGLGLGLSILSSHLAAGAAAQMGATSVDEPRLHDLTLGQIPPGTRGPATVRGYLHADWIVDEYAVADGKRPDQTRRAPVVLVPLLGIREGAIGPDDTIVVARVTRGTESRTARVDLTGTLEPLHPQLLDTVVKAAGGPGGAGLHGVLLDTLDRPDPQKAWISTALVVVCAALGAACLLFACAEGRPRSDRG